ncbi:T4SS efffector SepA family protein [Limimaricola cinnabarinus]|uniref:T4SS efffector SepA family protein n=1 Tax=Limimaricola cinnabarinus TaxID=1125964 RepID=UPI002490BF3A|nr:hypothetical protein [Limimaricola cinnabarinus]
MAPSVELTNETFKRLQAHAVPLVDTIETVIAKMIDSFESSEAACETQMKSSSVVKAFNPDTPPDLTHAKILGVSFNGEKLGRNQDNWNGLLHHSVRFARKTVKSDTEFDECMAVKFVEGIKLDEGYRPVAGTDISVQGQDANGAWRAANHIARYFGCSMIVKFAWREKEGAAYPGMTGQMEVIKKV